MSKITTAVLGLTLFAASGLAAEFEYYHFDTPVRLGMDVSMVAIFDESQPLETPSFALGITDAVAASTVEGWSYVKTPRTLQSIQGIEQLIDQLANSQEYDYVSPVFLGEGGLPYIPTRDLLVKRSTNSSASEVVTLLQMHGEILDTNFSGMDRVYRLRTTLRDGRSVLELANQLAVMDMFEFAESDAISWVEPSHIPNDPEFNQQWGLNQSNDHDMDLPEAWDISMGSESIVVVVLDSGIDQNHPDIHQLTGETFTGSSNNGNPSNGCDNHGTAVAGCVAATIDNNQGVAGVAPHCWVRAGKIFNEMDIFGFCLGFLEFQESWAVNGINWAADSGARVTNSSWGGGSPLSGITNAFNTTRAAGVFHVAAAGNDGSTTISWPGNLDSLISVAAMSSNGTLASFSTHGNGLFISAPGEGIRTTDRSGSAGYSSGNTTTIDGTSFASPYTAGVAALLLSVDPSLTPDQIEGVLSSTAVDYGAGGYDTTFGYGFINARAALEAVDTGDPCVGDINGDGAVGVADLLSVVDAWGTCIGCSADIDGDGTVGVSDLLAIVDAWGVCP
ncbi:MAG: S8 family serine peptidase [Phycisphaerales bacterium]|nr:S8 family serine peptidase [Phycisphaerales bacterium]